MDDRFKPASFDAISDNRRTSWVDKFRNHFRDCPVGSSFEVPLDAGKFGSIRSAVSMFNKGEKKFKAVKHEHCYEIHRRK